MAHTLDDNELKNTYFYHLSDDRIHDSYFTSHVIEELIQHTKSEGEQLEFITIKSDNCSSQYKSKKIFAFYSQLALDHQKMVLIYF